MTSVLRSGSGLRPGVGHDLPVLALGERPAFADADGLPGLDLVRFVVRQVTLRAHDELLVERVHEAALDEDRDGLLAGVAGDHPLERAARHSRGPSFRPTRAGARPARS